jgi:hypothetical protein
MGGATTAGRKLLFALTSGASAPRMAQCSAPAVGRCDANAPVVEGGAPGQAPLRRGWHFLGGQPPTSIVPVPTDLDDRLVLDALVYKSCAEAGTSLANPSHP